MLNRKFLTLILRFAVVAGLGRNSQQEALRVHHQVPSAALDLFVTVVAKGAGRPPFSPAFTVWSVVGRPQLVEEAIDDFA